ncbi:MAG: 5-(carboxyamino)imidazole ribonucleotide synthase [Chitinophagaceae bacterium]
MKVGILGGGQLGRMLLQQAVNYTVETWVLENDGDCPAAHLCHHFVLGDIRDYDAVLAFGRQVDRLTIEIESVNVDALEQLEKEGKLVVPSAGMLRIIKNKITQKQFYKQHEIPSPDFVVTQNLAELMHHKLFLPAVHKIGEGGYDGRGVQIIEKEIDLSKGFDAPGVLEKKVEIAREIAIMVAVNGKGQTAIYPAVQMMVDPYKNQLDYQICPAEIPEKILWKVEAIAIRLVQAFKSPGLFAVEMLIDRGGEVWVNETAPRVHNSGHHTIEAHYCSQYDMLWRILLDYPLGNPDAICHSSLVNLVGAEGFTGPVYYEGLDEVLKMENAFVHLYGKTDTKPGRKMGHVTILSKEKQELSFRAHKVKGVMKVRSV